MKGIVSTIDRRKAFESLSAGSQDRGYDVYPRRFNQTNEISPPSRLGRYHAARTVCDIDDDGDISEYISYDNQGFIDEVSDAQGSNVLNRSMQGLWSNHRRRVNLNAPPSSTPETVVSTPATEDAGPAVANSTEAPTVPAVPGTTQESDDSFTPNGKRKTRSSRTTEASSSKRSKIMTGSGGSSGKDYSPPATRLSDLGGVESCIEKMLELVAMPLCHPEVYLHTGVQPPRGVLLHGPPGCGKTLLAHAMAGELGVPFISISAPSIVSGMSGESEKTLRETFDEAKRVAPCLLFIDEIDAITPKRESAQREMERRIVAQFLTCMDDMSWDKTDNKPVIVIGATNRPDALDAALRRAGRFDHEICMSVPDDIARAQILKVLCAKLRLEGDFDFAALAKATPGYVGADLAALTGAAGIIAVKRIFKQLSEGSLTLLPPESGSGGEDVSMAVDIPSSSPVSLFPSLASSAPHTLAHFLLTHPLPLTPTQLEPLCLTSEDFHVALGHVQPSSKREGFATIPDVSWSDIGALRSLRQELLMSVVHPIRRPEVFAQVGVEGGCGVLMWGPPGCGKTLVAKAVARESRASFISVKGPEVLNKYVGESERAVRQLFSRARASAPCVIFFDELDALVPRRDDNLSESSARVVNTLLTELDGLEPRKQVYVIAATNRPDMIDPAMVRPGRLDKLLFVDLPAAEERAEIIRTLLRKVPVGSSEKSRGFMGDEQNSDEAAGKERVKDAIGKLVAERCDGYSGADLAALVREAAVTALRRTLARLDHFDEAGNSTSDLPSSMSTSDGDSTSIVLFEDFITAIEKIGPSVSPAQRRKYKNLHMKYAGLPVKGVRVEESRDDGESLKHGSTEPPPPDSSVAA
ncbi:hypothetical protein CVT24_005692 [Panaeolus cyanescens]|uniref:Peroxisomal ATPase PEX1 n=1 Tax=Panaeolus cyanescens TaxID=181874 RepID=A0A409V992_9AGAR|nr:hypothetical protein CVT24_005692 [Panaeolus cyanescens]